MKLRVGMMKNPALLLLLLLGSTHAGYLSDLVLVVKHQQRLVGSNIKGLASREWRALHAEKNNGASAVTAPYAVRQQQQPALAPPKDVLNHKRSVVEMEKLAREWADLNREHDSISSTMSSTTYKQQQQQPPLWSTPVTPSVIASTPSNKMPIIIPDPNKQHVTTATMQELAQQWTAMNRDQHDNRNRNLSSSSSPGSSIFQKPTPTRPVIPVTVPSSVSTSDSTAATTTTSPRPSLSAADLLARESAARNQERHEQPLYRLSRDLVGGVVESTSFFSASPPPRDDTTTSVLKKKLAFPQVDVDTKQFVPTPEALSAFSSSSSSSNQKYGSPPAKRDVTVPIPINDTKHSPPPPLPPRKDTSIPHPALIAKEVDVWAAKTKTIDEISADSAQDDDIHKQLERDCQDLATLALELQKVEEEIQMLRKKAKSDPSPLVNDHQFDMYLDDGATPEDVGSFATLSTPVNTKIPVVEHQLYVGMADPQVNSSNVLPYWVLASLDSQQFDDENDDKTVVPTTNGVFAPLPPAINSKKTTLRKNGPNMMAGAESIAGRLPANRNTNVPDWVLAAPVPQFPGNNKGPPPKENVSFDLPVVNHENPTAAADPISDFQPTAPTMANNNYSTEWLLAASPDPKLNDDAILSSSKTASSSFAASPAMNRKNSVPTLKTTASHDGGASSFVPSWVTDSQSSQSGGSSFAPSWVTGSRSSFKNKDSPAVYGWTSPAPLAKDVIKSLAPQVAADPVETTTSNASNTNRATSTKLDPKSRNGSVLSETHSPVFSPVMKNREKPAAVHLTAAPQSIPSSGNVPAWVTAGPSPPMTNSEKSIAASRSTTASQSTPTSGNVPAWVTAGSSSPIMNSEKQVLEGWTMPTTPSDHASGMIASLNNVVLNSKDNDDDFATQSFASHASKAFSRPIDVASPTKSKVNLSGSKVISSTSSAVPSWVTAIDIDNYVDLSLATVEPDSSLTAMEAVASAFTSRAAKNHNETHGNAKVAALIQEREELNEEMRMRKGEKSRPIQPLVLIAKPHRDVTALEAISSASSARNSRDWAAVNRRDPVVKSRDVTALEAISSASTAKSSREWAASNRRDLGNPLVVTPPAVLQELEELDEEMRMRKGENFCPIQPLVLTDKPRRDATALEAISSASSARNSRDWAAVTRRGPLVKPRDVTALEAISSASTAKSSREWAASNHRDPVNNLIVTPPARLSRDAQAVLFASAAKLACEWAKQNLNMNSKDNSTLSRPAFASLISTPKSDVPPPRTQSASDENEAIKQTFSYSI